MPEESDVMLKSLLRRVRRVELQARSALGDLAAGAYRSRFRGQGMEFDRVRSYSPGDDVRSIDWNVTARTGEPFVKIFREERELSIILLVDVSGSMHCGGIAPWSHNSKMLSAAEAAAVIALIALRNQDRVGLWAFTEVIERHLPCRRGRNHVLRVVRELLGFQSGQQSSNLTQALEELRRSQHRRSIIFVVSDFLDPVLDLAPALRHLRQRNEVIGIRITDPSEEDLPQGSGSLWVADPESSGYRPFRLNRRAASRYRSLFAAQAQAVGAAFQKTGCDLIEISSDSDVVTRLSRFFARRRSRRNA